MTDIENLWDIPEQEYTSKNTNTNFSSKKLPAVFTAIIKSVGYSDKGYRNLDIGGGKYSHATDALIKIGIKNLVYDPFNRSVEHNQKVVNEITKNPVDFVTISNVLNVVKEKENQVKILSQAYFALKPQGCLYITVYEGGIKLNTTPRKTLKGWQNYKSLQWYLPVVLEIFPNAKIGTGLFKHIIVASK